MAGKERGVGEERMCVGEGEEGERRECVGGKRRGRRREDVCGWEMRTGEPKKPGVRISGRKWTIMCSAGISVP